jgi:hypothetical protein
MDNENKSTEPAANAADAPSAPAEAPAASQNALEQTSEEAAATTPVIPGMTAEGSGDGTAAAASGGKKPSGLKALFHKFNVYLLLFLLVVVLAAVISVLSYLNSTKQPTVPSINSQELNAETLKQLANSNATVGGSGQTLTVQGNAIFSGEVLVRSNFSAAGDIKLGGNLAAQNLTASGTVNLANTQISTLQVATGSTFQGTVTVQHDLNVGGAASFSGPITVNQITASKLILAGNAQLEVPNHLAFTGPPPNRTGTNGSVLGSGGSASIDGSDTSGTINVNTGSGTSPGCFITVAFHQTYSGTPRVLVSPVGAGAGPVQFYVNRSATGFSLCTANAAPANQTFSFDYFVAG